MTTHVDHIDDLMIFLEVVEAGGFSAASRRTGRSTSLISRRIQDLERKLGVGLLVRDSRRFAVTPVGKGIVEHAVRIRSEAQAAYAFAADSADSPTGVLRVSCPVKVAASLVGPLAMDLATQHPQLQIKISTYNGRASEQEASADIVILPSIGALKDADIVARRLGECQYLLVAAPELADRYRHVSTPQDVEGIPAVGWTFHDSPSSWVLQDPTGARETIHVDVRFLADTLSLVSDAALRGLGAAQLPVMTCKNDIAEGRLCDLLQGWTPPPVTLYAVYPSRRSLSRGGRLFVDLLSRRFQATHA